MAHNIIYIKDVLQENKEFISFDEYRNKVGIMASNMIDYVTIIKGITMIKNKITFTESKLTFKNHEIDSLSRRKIYQILQTEEKCYCEKMWENKFENKICDFTWSNIFTCTKETKLQDFQWKIVHNIFPTNILLNRMGIKNTEKCETCGVTEYVEHMFYECKRIENFWNKVESLIKIKFDKNIKLDKINVILGIEQDERYNKFTKREVFAINEILIIAKLSISKSKVYDTNIEITFERELKLRKKID